jgi:hypothetical protein
MATTPYQFGTQLGKQAFIMLPATGIGAGLGAITAPTGQLSGLDDAAVRAESVSRGATKGFGTGLGLTLGSLLAAAATRGKLRIPREALTSAGRAARDAGRRPPPPNFMYTDGMRFNKFLELWMQQKGIPRAAGTLAGGGLGYAGADAVLGKPSWNNDK